MTNTMEEKKSTQSKPTTYRVKKNPNLKVNARVRPILIDRGLTVKFFEGEEIEVNKEQYDSLSKRQWIEVKDGK